MCVSYFHEVKYIIMYLCASCVRSQLCFAHVLDFSLCTNICTSFVDSCDHLDNLIEDCMDWDQRSEVY